MTKTIVVLFALLVFCTVNATKEVTGAKLEEKADNTEDIKNDENDDNVEDESASIQVVHKDIVNKVNDVPLDDEEEDHVRDVPEDTNSTNGIVNYNKFFEELINDSDDIIIETNPEDKIEEVLIPSGTSIDENKDYSNRQEEIAIVFEQITKASNPNENYGEDSTVLDEDENNWRSAENLHSDNKEYLNEEISLEDDDKDYNDEDYMDKKIDLNGKGRMELRKPERREQNTRPMNIRQYGPPDDHILDSVPRRNFGEIMVPRYRPTLTRNGIVYTPTFYTVQTVSPILQRLSGQNWSPNRPQFNPEREIFTRSRQNKILGISPYEPDSKMIDDYNDYGSNTYSYTPVVKITTQAPPQQIMAPNKFDIFQKLVEASDQPKLPKRTFNDNAYSGNYYSQRQYSDSYGAFDARRLRRNAWDELLLEDI